MQVREIRSLLNAEILIGENHMDRKVTSAFGSDLMSDVLAYVDDESVLLTGLANQQVIRTAEMLDLKTIVFVRGKNPGEDVVKLAKELNMVLLMTKLTMYTSSGILYSNGLKGVNIG